MRLHTLALYTHTQPQYHETIHTSSVYTHSLSTMRLCALAPYQETHHMKLKVSRCRYAMSGINDCVCFGCCSRLRPLQLLLPNCVHFNCCSPIASTSTAAPRLHISACSPSWISSPCPRHNVLEHSSRRSRFSKLKYEGGASLV